MTVFMRASSSPDVVTPTVLAPESGSVRLRSQAWECHRIVTRKFAVELAAAM